MITFEYQFNKDENRWEYIYGTEDKISAVSIQPGESIEHILLGFSKSVRALNEYEEKK